MSHSPLFHATICTLFPDMFPGPLGQSIAGKALDKGLWQLDTVNIQEFGQGNYNKVDDTPYGGGAGMVMKPDVVHAAIENAKEHHQKPRIIYTSPRGVPFNQGLAQELKAQELIIVCGRYEGLDQRVIDHHNMLEVSLGDYVLSGGEIAALAMLDAIVRLIPGVMGNEATLDEESFNISAKSAGLLEYPHYTRPPEWMDKNVPDVLLSGNHKEIDKWRLEQAKIITEARRPDLLDKQSED